MMHVTQAVWERKAKQQEVGAPKNGKARDIPLGEEVFAALRAHRHLRGPLVFCKPNGGMLTHAACEWAIDCAARAAGLPARPTKAEKRKMVTGELPPPAPGSRPPVGWHTLRHYAGNLIIPSGLRRSGILAEFRRMGSA